MNRIVICGSLSFALALVFASAGAGGSRDDGPPMNSPSMDRCGLDTQSEYPGTAIPQRSECSGPRYDFPGFQVGTGAGPTSVAAVDLDGDGDLDLATANQIAGGCTTLINMGCAVYSNRVDIPLGGRPSAISSADVDGDGVADLLVANESLRRVSVLRNSGDGQAFGLVEFSVADAPTSMAIADLDLDGSVDVVLASASAGTITVAWGGGHDGFAAQLHIVVSGQPKCLAIADADGDALPDILFAEFASNGIGRLRNEGSRGFARLTDIPCTAGPVAIAASDIDNDADVDLVSANSADRSVQIFVNSGAGQFESAGVIPLATTPLCVSIADIDDDGVSDIFCGLEDSTLSVLSNVRPSTAPSIKSIRTGKVPVQVVVAEIDGIGCPELVVVHSGARSVGIHMNDCTGEFSERSEAFVLGIFDESEVADIDCDGDLDVAISNRNTSPGSRSVVLINEREGGFRLDDTVLPATPFRKLVFGDIDGDVDLDIMMISPFITLANDGHGRFTNLLTVVPEGSADGQLADFDGDRRIDIALCGDQSGVRMYYNMGRGSFPLHPVAIATPQAIRRMFAADLDHDGDQDMFLFGSQCGIYIARNAGARQFVVELVTGGGCLGNTVECWALADIDADQDLDVVVADPTRREVRWFVNSGGAFAISPEIVKVDGFPTDVALTDVTGDGVLDLIIADSTSNSVGIRSRSGVGLPWIDLGDYSAVGVRSMHPADFDLDGDVDLLTVGQIVSVQSSYSVIRNERIRTVPGNICTADVTGDGMIGTLDLVFVLARFGSVVGSGTLASRADFDRDGVVGTNDLVYFLCRFGDNCP